MIFLRNKTERRFLICMMAFAAVMIILSVVIPYYPSDPINKHVYAQIQLGMTRQEVEDVIGLPPGFYPPRLVTIFATEAWDEEWVGRRIAIVAKFDDDGFLCRKELGRIVEGQPGFPLAGQEKLDEQVSLITRLWKWITGRQ